MSDGASVRAAMPDVELLYWEGCPSHGRALTELRMAMTGLGLDPDAVTLREVVTDDEAARLGFTGSPTILVNGRDVVDSAGEPVMLACRVYRRRDGRIAPTPDPDDVHKALQGAISA